MTAICSRCPKVLAGSTARTAKASNSSGQPANPSQRQRVPQDAGCDRERGKDRNKDQCIGDQFRRQSQHAGDHDAGGIDQDRHRRVGLDDIDVEPLTVKHAFGGGQQPAHIGVGGEQMPASPARCRTVLQKPAMAAGAKRPRRPGRRSVRRGSASAWMAMGRNSDRCVHQVLEWTPKAYAARVFALSGTRPRWQARHARWRRRLHGIRRLR